MVSFSIKLPNEERKARQRAYYYKNKVIILRTHKLYRERHLNWYKKYCKTNRKHINKTKAAWKKRRRIQAKSDPDMFIKVFLTDLRERARAKKVPFNLTPTDITIPTHCPVLGIKLKRSDGKNHKFNDITVDRIRPKGGYTRNNIIVVSRLANNIKSYATIKQIEKVVNFYSKRKK